eukprot:scaffold227346_cov15-Tisochrysis_lutea.AAC.1
MHSGGAWSVGRGRRDVRRWDRRNLEKVLEGWRGVLAGGGCVARAATTADDRREQLDGISTRVHSLTLTTP